MSKSILPKMLARSGVVGEGLPDPGRRHATCHHFRHLPMDGNTLPQKNVSTKKKQKMRFHFLKTENVFF